MIMTICFRSIRAQLLVADMVVAKLFVNKRTTTVAAEFSAEELAAGKADWHPLATKLDGHNDYWYFGRVDSRRTLIRG